jgi:tetratricopeptide (TPR) repeat protein
MTRPFRLSPVPLALALLGIAAARGQEPPTFPVEDLPGFRAEAAALMLEGVEGGTLPMAILADPEKTAGDNDLDESGQSHRVPFAVEVPGPFLLDAIDQRPGRLETTEALELYVYALDTEGAVRAHLARRAELDRIDLTRLDRAGLKLSAAVQLLPGDYTLRVLVLLPTSRLFGLRSVELTLPAADEFALGPPRFPDQCEEWIGGAEGPPGPADLSARPVLRTKAPVRFSTHRPPQESPDPRFTVQLTASSGERFETGAREVPISRELGSVTGSALVLEFTTPDLPAGIYDMTLRMEQGSDRSESPALETWIVDAEWAPPSTATQERCDLTWGRVLAAAAGRAPSLAEEPRAEPSNEPRSKLDRSTRLAYHRTLEELRHQGDTANAARRLAHFEVSTLDGDPRRLGALSSAERETARGALEHEPRALLPLLILHAEVYREHFRNKHFALATQSRELVLELAALVDRPQFEADRSLVAALLIDLGHAVESHGMAWPSRQLLERALELAPRNEAALQMLAYIEEKSGLYEAARERLVSLVGLNAKNMEARFRLAVMLDRTGQRHRCELTLRRILREGADGWLLSLSYQTLARLLGSEGRFADAVSVLEEGARVVPGDHRLLLQLAYGLKRTGRQREAAELLTRIPRRDESRDLGARHRYTAPPDSLLGPCREQLATGFRLRLGHLEQAASHLASGVPTP